jgi:hypothetical protein
VVLLAAAADVAAASPVFSSAAASPHRLSLVLHLMHFVLLLVPLHATIDQIPSPSGSASTSFGNIRV